MKLSRPARRATLVVHVVASASWLGLTLGLLALGGTAAGTGSPVTVEASVRAMKLFADWLLLPVASLTLLSGLLLSLGTVWGLARHRWVYTKFWLTLATTSPSMRASSRRAVSGSKCFSTWIRLRLRRIHASVSSR